MADLKDYKTEGLIEKSIFYFYAVFIAPAVIPVLRNALKSHDTVPWAGWLIIAALILETAGIWWLSSLWRFRGGMPYAAGLPMRLGAGLVISHVLLSYFLLLFAMDMLGLMAGKEKEPSAIAITLMVTMFFREFIFWFGAAAKRNVNKEPSQLKVMFGRFFLFLFRIVSFTVYWDTIIQIEGIKGVPILLWIVLGPAIVLIFMIIYLPMRAAELLELCFYRESPKMLAKMGWSIIMNASFLALYPIVVEYVRNLF